MKLLGVFSTDQMLGGGEVSFTLSLAGLQNHGFEILALVPGEGPLARHLEQNRIQHVVAPQETLRRGGAVRFLLQGHPAWIAVLRRFRPDVIHCNAIRSALYGQAAGRAAGVPVVFHARTAMADPVFDHFLMATVSRIVCTSNVVRNRFPAWMGADRLAVVPNAFDPEYLRPPSPLSVQLHRQWSGSASGALIGVVGRLAPDKGQHLVVEAAGTVLARHPETRFVFVGGEDPSHPGYEAELLKQIHASGLGRSVMFAGFVPDMKPVYDALDVVVFPSRSEGFGRVIIEAGAVQKPVIVSRLPAFDDILPASVADEVTAWDASEFADRLDALLNNPARRLAIAKELHEHVKTHFGLDRHVSMLTEVYAGLLKRPDRMPGGPMANSG